MSYILKVKTWVQQSLLFMRGNMSLVFIALLALFLYTINLQEGAFIDYDEAAYAQVVRETIASGNPFTFTFANEPWFDKPPFYFWAAILTEKFLHPFTPIETVDDNGKTHPTEFAMRFPSAVGGVLCVILTWLIVFERTKSRRVATAAALVLITTGTFIENVRQVRLDAPVAATVLFAYYSYLRAGGDRRWTTGVWTGISIGIMIKSVVGLLAIPIIIIDFIVRSNHRDVIERLTYFFNDKYAKVGLLGSFILIVPWHLYQTLLYGKMFWNQYLFNHVIERFNQNLFPSDITFSQFFGWFISGALPWAVLLVIFGALMFIPSFFHDRSRYRFFLSSIISAACIFFLFALSKTKAPSYLTPIYPFMAISVTLGIEAIRYHYFQEHHARHTATLLTVTGSVVMIIIAITASMSIGFRRFDSLQVASIYAEEEKTIGQKIRTSTSTLPIFYTTEDKWETVRFYSQSRQIAFFDRENASSTLDYYIIAPRPHLASALNSPAVKYSKDFTIEYMGDLLTLIKIENEEMFASTTLAKT